MSETRIGKTDDHSTKELVGSERNISAESHGFVRIDGEDLTADLIGDKQDLIDEIEMVVKSKGLRNEEIQGVMFNKQVGTAFVKYSTKSITSGETFLSLSAADSSFTSHGAREIGRSTYTALDGDRGYIQRKPCGLRTGDLPFNLSVPKRDFINLQDDFGESEDIPQRYLDELASGSKGPVTMHIDENWAVFNGVLASFARTELVNGVRFAQLYKKVWGDYPTGQIPVAVHAVNNVLMPDGTVKPTLDVFVARLQEKPLELSTLKTRLLSHERDRLKAQGKRGREVMADLVNLKRELDVKSLEGVAQRFLDEDPFVQIDYHVPSFARLSFRHILANADKYDVIRQMATSNFGENGEFSVARELHDSVVRELVNVAGQEEKSIQYPGEDYYLERIERGEKYQTVFEDWRKKFGDLNKELFGLVAESEVSKMSKSTATVNAVGAAFGNPVWRSNMIGGSPCDWDHIADNSPECLPQAGEPYDFNVSNFQTAVMEQQKHIGDDIDALCYLLGINSSVEYQKPYEKKYLEDLKLAKKILVDSADCDLDIGLKKDLLTLGKFRQG